MTIDEFPQFMSALEAQMPTIAAHAGKHPAMLASWRREVEDITLADAAEAISRMRRGDSARPGMLDRDFFPAFLQSAVSELRYERIQQQQAAEDAGKLLQTGANVLVKVSMAECFKAACEERRRATEAGEDPETAVHEVVKKMLADVPEDKRDRMRCRTCRDTGVVECWNVAAMADARRSIKQDVDPQGDRWRTCHVSCNCQVGKSKWTSRTGGSVKQDDMPRYEDGKWVRVSIGRQALLEWAAAYKPANYSDFGDYGEF